MINLSRVRKQIIAVLVDLVFLPLMFVLALTMRYDVVTHDIFARYLFLILAVPVFSIPIFIRIGLYRAVIRFIDQKIVYTVVFGVTLSVILLVALAAFLTHMLGLSRGVFGIYWVTANAYVVASRFLARGILVQRIEALGVKRVIIYGAGKAGIQLARALGGGSGYLPVAFVDDKKELYGVSIAGIKVHDPKELPLLVKKGKVDEVLLAMPSLNKIQQRKILDHIEPLRIKTRVTPSIDNLINGRARIQDIRDIEIEDLLGREPVQADLKLASHDIHGKTVLVTGAGGSIGSELCRQIFRLKPARLLLLEISEYALYSIEQELVNNPLDVPVQVLPFLGSVLDYDKCRSIFETFCVETVYHAAAYKHVPLVEHNPVEGVKNNIFGTLNLARAAINAKVRTFVLVSTDKAVRPTNIMGCTKRFAELILQAFARQQSDTKFCMVRFGNVLGSSGSVVPLFRKQIMQGGPITVTHPEITRYFMTIPEAAQLVLQAGAMSTGGDVFVLDMGEPVKIIDLARRMVHLSGYEIKSDTTPEGTIEIRHIGLRPGEKLYEELLIGHDVEGTSHPLIMRACEAEIEWNVLEKALKELEMACNRFNIASIRNLLLEIVHEYQPQCGIEDFIWRIAHEESQV